MKNQTAQNVSVTESLTRTWWKNATSDVKVYTIKQSMNQLVTVDWIICEWSLFNKKNEL